MPSYCCVVLNDAHQRGPLRVIVAPDSFKGSAAARDVAQAIRAGILAGFSESATGVEVVALPLADGGEGSFDAVIDAWEVATQHVETTDALGRPVRGRYGISPDGTTGIIETADANGLPRVSDLPLQPRRATTRGVGIIVRALLDRGVDEIVLFIGGSATTDGGAGLLAELGARLQDAQGHDLADGGGSLEGLHTLDLSALDSRAATVRWRIACDVTNPLTGPRGAATVFGPQKGADPTDVAALDRGLARWADVLAQATGVDVRERAGTGAAGGLAAPLVALFDAALEPGWRIVAEAVGAERHLADADVVLTGEGRLDAPSLQGKVVSGVREMTPPGAPLIVLAGEVALDAAQLADAGITAAFSIARGPRSLAEMRDHVLDDLTFAAASVGRLLASTTTHGKGAPQ